MNEASPKKGDILLVDDTAANLRLLSTFLNENGFKTRSVISGQMALTAIQSSPPDLVLLDITMPEMDGYQVATRLKGDPQTADIPIIFISALDETLDKVKAFEVGGVDYITKPFQFEEVLARVETHLTLRGLQRELEQQNEILEERVQERTADLQILSDSYQRFVPGEFLNHLHKKSIIEVGLGDQMQRQMTIMFTDIRNFTSISEQMTPQENINFLNAYLGLVTPIIRQHNGFIDKYLGDGMIALFPERPEDAIDAIIAIRQALVAFNRDSGCPPVKVGAGLHSGPVMIGIIGEENRMQSTVIGDAVNLTSRLESMTKEYGVSVLVCQGTIASLENPSQYHSRRMDHVRARGKKDPIVVHEVFNGDEPEMLQKKLSTKDAFEEGMNLFHQQMFAEASVQFKNVLEANPDDRAAKIYLERAARYMVQGTPADWGQEHAHEN
ncbi:adenylate/guanylate cyclase domain-containing protein [Chloroflexota bacterium]